MENTQNKTKTIFYCKCGQAVRLRKKDNNWVHYGYKKMHEPYKDFLERTNHQVEIADKISFFNPSGTPEAKRRKQQNEILRSIFG